MSLLAGGLPLLPGLSGSGPSTRSGSACAGPGEAFSLQHRASARCGYYRKPQPWGIPHRSRGAEEIIALAHEQGFAYWLARETMWKGRALVAQGRQNEKFAEVRQDYAAMLTVGSDIHKTFQSVPMAQAHGTAGEMEEGLNLLTETLTFIEKTGVRCCEAEIYRGKGELTLQKGARDLGLGTNLASP